MNELDFQILLRAKRQIERESSVRSFLIVGICFAAVLRMLSIDLPVLYPLLFIILLVYLVVNSDFVGNRGLISKRDLVKLIERNINNDPDTLSRYSQMKSRS